MRRLRLLALFTVLVGVLTLPLVAHAAALPKPTLTLTAASAPTVGEDVTLAVTSTGLSAGDPITLEKFNGLLYSAVATAPASATGTASFAVPVASTKAVKYRVSVKASATHQAATSAQLTVTGVLAQPVLTLALQGHAVVNTPTTLVATGTRLSNGEAVKLEKWGGLTWGSAGTAPYDAVTGQVAFTITPANTKATRYRATVVKTTTHAAAASPELTVTALATAPGPGAPTCGTTPVAKADGTLWVCSFEEEFNASALDRTKWTPQTNFVNGRLYSEGPPYAYACYIDDPSVISQSNGTLKLTTRKMSSNVLCPKSADSSKNIPDVPYASGQVSTYGRFNQEHGRFEARMKSPGISPDSPTKLHEAFWLWPAVEAGESLFPATGEIDVSETYSEYPTLSVPFLHYDATGPTPYTGSNSGVANTAWNCVAHRGEWNTFTLEWDATKLQIWVNGNLCMVNTSKSPMLNKKYIVALTSAMGRASTGYDGVDAGPKTLEVDYVHVWK
ncbi:glycoside hydrolase family 16 protein [Nocardioides sp. WS12]|uniref:glycoside hydrolase family 16 protein n=1 Tax=Nocardioides sp. WS12 TaxID=2486272 RepID=UPI0015FB3E2E|nr:glycoside hydrolase family 16 protein [Nocardioides sp. WS12]